MSTLIKKLKIVILFVSVLTLLISCKEETSYRMQLRVKNETDSKQTIELFPKTDYLMANRNDLYMYSDIGNGDFGDRIFELGVGDDKFIFITSDLEFEPHKLLEEVFDSIFIVPFNENTTMMKFYPDSVVGYSENMFDNNAIWIYELRNYDEPDNFNQNPVESREYNFVISKDKYR